MGRSLWGTGALRSEAAEVLPEVVEGYKESIQFRLQGMGWLTVLQHPEGCRRPHGVAITPADGRSPGLHTLPAWCP